MKGVIDVQDGRGMIAHHSHVDNLKRILQEGILSYKFVERAGEKVEEIQRRTEWDMLVQKTYGMEMISFYDGDLARRMELEDEDYYKLFRQPGESEVRFLNLIAYGGGFSKEDPMCFDFVILLNKKNIPTTMGPVKRRGRSAPKHREVFLKRRVAPRFFSALVFSSQGQILSSVSEVLRDFLHQYQVPVYSPIGDLIWPKRMSLEEVRQWITQRDCLE